MGEDQEGGEEELLLPTRDIVHQESCLYDSSKTLLAIAPDLFGEDEIVDWDEKEEVPQDLRHLDPRALRRTVLWRAAWMVLLGTFLIFAFSDPMVDILDQVGDRLGIGSFYAAFLLTPLTANGK